MNNAYEFILVRNSDGVGSLADSAMSLQVFAPDMVTARDIAIYQNRKQGWKSTPRLIDVRLNQSAFAHIAVLQPQNGEGVSSWYVDHVMHIRARLS